MKTIFQEIVIPFAGMSIYMALGIGGIAASFYAALRLAPHGQFGIFLGLWILFGFIAIRLTGKFFLWAAWKINDMLPEHIRDSRTVQRER